MDGGEGVGIEDAGALGMGERWRGFQDEVRGAGEVLPSRLVEAAVAWGEASHVAQGAFRDVRSGASFLEEPVEYAEEFESSKERTVKHWWVLTPVYTTYYGEDDPPEDGRDAVTVFADTRRQAKILAVKTKELKAWVRMQRQDQVNPFVGLEVIEAGCEHGKCNCDVCRQDCEECERLSNEHQPMKGTSTS